MKSVRVLLDEDLLLRLDDDEEVRRDGRSAVIRRAIAQYLALDRRLEIAESYARGYENGASPELDGWAGKGAWPGD